MLVDLHTHSTFSDGRYTPSQLVKMAAEAGIGILGITDHDSVNGIEEALNAAAAVTGAPEIAKGVELCLIKLKKCAMPAKNACTGCLIK